MAMAYSSVVPSLILPGILGIVFTLFESPTFACQPSSRFGPPERELVSGPNDIYVY
jgi:hypothetical protein